MPTDDIDTIIDDIFPEDDQVEEEDKSDAEEDDSSGEEVADKGEKKTSKTDDSKPKKEEEKPKKALVAVSQDADADQRAFEAGEIYQSIREELTDTFGKILTKEQLKTIASDIRKLGINSIANIYNTETHIAMGDAMINRLRREGKLKDEGAKTKMRDTTGVGNTAVKEKPLRGLAYTLSKFGNDPIIKDQLEKKGVIKK